MWIVSYFIPIWKRDCVDRFRHKSLVQYFTNIRPVGDELFLPGGGGGGGG
jgi:hypothetical protein